MARNLLSSFESPDPGIDSSEKSRSNIRLTAKGFISSLVWELTTKLRLLQRPVSTSYARIQLQDDTKCSPQSDWISSNGLTGPIIPHPRRVRTA